MKILSFDISKTTTGVAFYDGKDFETSSIAFENTLQWEKDVKHLIDTWSPDLVVFSETVNRMCGHNTNRYLYGLMFLLEAICHKLGTQVQPVNDTPCKHHIGVKMRKRAQIKEDTLAWAKQYAEVNNDDEADAMCFAYYAYQHFTPTS